MDHSTRPQADRCPFLDDGTPVIIDFDSCTNFGNTLAKGGTPGWSDENFDPSDPENDYYGLRRIEEAMSSSVDQDGKSGRTVWINCKPSSFLLTFTVPMKRMFS